eukprot:tig00000113_g5624.t1
MSGSIGGERGSGGSAVFNHSGVWKLIVVGGGYFSSQPWVFYNDIIILDLSTNTWSSTGLNHNLGTGDTGATTIACAWDQESAVYCAGGINGFEGAVASPKGFKYLYGTNTLVDLSPSVARPRPIRSLAQFGWTTGVTYGHIVGTCSGLFFMYQHDGSRPTKAYSFDPANDTTARDVAIGGIDGTAPIFQFGAFGDDGNCRM